MTKIHFQLNGKPIEVETRKKTLLQLLREQLGLSGTKCGCDSGDCGVCGVLIDGKFIRSCLILTADLPGQRVETIEGLTPEDGSLSDLQQAFLDHGAVQCGFCTPAMVVAGEALLRRTLSPSREEIRLAISPVLCRCTGYQQIVDAIEATAQQRRQKQQPVGALAAPLPPAHGGNHD